MPSAKAVMPHSRKRQLSEAEPEPESLPQAPTKQRKLEEYQEGRRPSRFWDNLSKIWLAGDALEEFDYRTVWPAAPVPPLRTGKENIDFAKLKRFARHGGPSLGDIRGYPDPESSVSSSPTMNSIQSGSRKRAKTGNESDTPSKKKKISAESDNFEQHLIDHGIYPVGYDGDKKFEQPANMKDIKRRLAQRRPSLTPSHFTGEHFLDFTKKNWQARSESRVMTKVFPIIAGTADIPSEENLRFTNLQNLTDGSITQAQPDIYDGARPEDLDKQIREEFGPYIVPSTNTAVLCLPNFFTEVKGPKGSELVSKRQAMYDGALGARGMHELRSYVDPETAYDNNAYTITSTYHPSGILKIYTSHPVESTNPKHRTEYRMTQIVSHAMTGDPEDFRKGAAAWRNVRDLTRDQRMELIGAANEKALNAERPGLDSSMQSLVSTSSNDTIQPESETSVNELALEINVVAGSNHRIAAGTQKILQPETSSNRFLEEE